MASLLLCLAAVVAVDLFLHHLFADRSGVNVQGYRGPVLAEKAPGEVRVAVLGGSTAFGYRVRPHESFPAILERLLARQLEQPVSIVNLAYNNESAVCFAPTLEHYAYLEPDVVLLYSGYNDLSPRMYWRQPSDCYRQRSPIFRLTGYLPLLPEAVRSLYYQVRYGSVERGYQEEQGRMLFLPDWTSFDGGETAEANQAKAPEADLAVAQRDRYIALIDEVVSSQLALGRAVVFVTQPYLNQAHRQQQGALRSALGRFGASPRFRYVDLGDAVDLRDPDRSFDGMHLTAAGNQHLAAELAAPMSETIRSLVQERSR